MKEVSALILSTVDLEFAVSSATFCLISGDAVRVDAVRFSYQTARSFHVPLVFARRAGSLGKYLIPMRPAMERHGGMSFSILIPGTSSSSHVNELPPLSFSRISA